MNNLEMTRARSGAMNLLTSCVGANDGQSILVVRSDGADDYEPDVAEFVAGVAHDMGCRTETLEAPAIDSPDDFPDVLAHAMQQVDHTVFFSRIGDQMRFCSTPGHGTKTMTYVLTLELLVSAFCAVPHGLMAGVLERLTELISTGGTWHITCPMGTDITTGSAPFVPTSKTGDFTVSLFPIGVFRPLQGPDMSGRIVTRWISPTLNRVYEPAGFVLDEPVVLEIDKGHIVGFSGPEAERVRKHYDYVAKLFGIDGSIVHSWHAGIHPKTWYDGSASASLIRWGTLAFNSPRYTHFHTCGDYPPGEISPVLIDATITFNGETLWQDGQFVFLKRPEIVALKDDFADAGDAFDQVWDIGL